LQDPALTRSLQDTVNLYQGDLLEGCYEDWCLYERERLQGMFLNALTQLMVCYRTQGNYDQAIDCGQRILSYDPLMEEIHREMMSLYAVAGHRGAALRQYRLCREVLARELKIAPMEETDALYAQICNGARLPDQSLLFFDARRAVPSAGPPPQEPDCLPSLQYVHDALSELQLVQAELQLLNVHFQKGVHALETCCQRLLH
jgi:DNA-binding SARP family transcriptional activator